MRSRYKREVRSMNWAYSWPGGCHGTMGVLEGIMTRVFFVSPRRLMVVTVSAEGLRWAAQYLEVEKAVVHFQIEHRDAAASKIAEWKTFMVQC